MELVMWVAHQLTSFLDWTAWLSASAICYVMVELVILHICFSNLVDINVDNFGTNSSMNYFAESLIIEYYYMFQHDSVWFIYSFLLLYVLGLN